jgi:hypothetical protein
MDSWMGVGRGWVPWRFRSVSALTTQLLDIEYVSERFWCWWHHKKWNGTHGGRGDRAMLGALAYFLIDLGVCGRTLEWRTHFVRWIKEL